jgi:hypothetical protein
MFEWLFRSLRQVTFPEDAVAAAWFAWSQQPTGVLIDGVLSRPAEHPSLARLIEGTVAAVTGVPAYSSRIAVVQQLYNDAVWTLQGSQLAGAYVEHLLLPQVMALPIGGIPRVTGMTLHYDAARNEWYVSTEGSNFLLLYTQETGLAINRRRCYTTNVMELIACLGLEAVCGVYANGDMARSLGIANSVSIGVNQNVRTFRASVYVPIHTNGNTDRERQLQAPRGPSVQSGDVAGRQSHQHHGRGRRAGLRDHRGPRRPAVPRPDRTAAPPTASTSATRRSRGCGTTSPAAPPTS